MKIIFRITEDLLKVIRRDLARPHAFAEERVGFVSTKAAEASGSLIIFAQQYHPISDQDYLRDDSVGAMIGQEGIRKALEIALLSNVGIFHIHQHDFPGRTWFSKTDLREQQKFVPDFFKVRQNLPHGAVVLGLKDAAGRVWLSSKRIELISEFNIVGNHLDVNQGGSGRVDFYA